MTVVGDEDNGGFDPASLQRIWEAARLWYRAGMQPAIQLCLRYDGRVVLNRAIGHAWGNGPADPEDAKRIPVTPQTPFCVYSAARRSPPRWCTCSWNAGPSPRRSGLRLPARLHQSRQAPHHDSACDDPQRRCAVCHRPPADLRRMNDSDYAREKLGELKPIHRPGLVHIYHGLTWGPLVREIVSAATGRNIREILATEILDPLGFRWTNYGVAKWTSHWWHPAMSPANHRQLRLPQH